MNISHQDLATPSLALRDHAGTLTQVTTDYGADGDDQKAIKDMIDHLPFGQRITFIVNGPHPQLAAAAIWEYYHHKTGGYPLIAVGKQAGQGTRPESEIFSLVDGAPIRQKNVHPDILDIDQLQHAMDELIHTGTIRRLHLVVIAPLHSSGEHYNLDRPEVVNDPNFQRQLNNVELLATTQFQRVGSNYIGNNYQKSEDGAADRYLDMLRRYNFRSTVVDGAVAKRPPFQMLVKQQEPELRGIGNGFEAYLAGSQVPWLYNDFNRGEMPSAEQLHAGMFTGTAAFPFILHAAAANPAGMGFDRALSEICGIKPNTDHHKFAEAAAPIRQELSAFDEQVLRSLLAQQRQHAASADIVDVASMKSAMHCGMTAALNEFAKLKNIAGDGECIDSFRALYARAQPKGVTVGNSLEEFRQTLFAVSPITKIITDIATVETNALRENGRSHKMTLAAQLGSNGALFTAYDDVTWAASTVVERSQKLTAHFIEAKTSIVNITVPKVDELQQHHPELHDRFVRDVRALITRDGTAMALRM